MEFPELYDIQFDKLKLGKHEFNFKPDNTFFELFEKSAVKDGNISVLVVFNKQSNRMFNIDFIISGNTNLTCDRCLNNFNYEINNTFSIIVKFRAENEKIDEEKKTIDDDIIFLSSDAKHINVAHYIYEFINLSIPMKIACNEPNENCDTDVLKKLNQINKSKNIKDPRWDVLKKLTDNKN